MTCHTEKLGRESETEKAGETEPRSNLAAIDVALGRYLGCCPDHAGKQRMIASRINDVIVSAAREADRLYYLPGFFAISDAQRAVQETPLPFTTDLACQVAKAGADEHLMLMAYIGNMTVENKRKLVAAVRRDLDAERECLLALEAQ